MAYIKFIFWLALFCLAGSAIAQTEPKLAAGSSASYKNLPPELNLVPQTLLGLIHAPEVQQEIGLENATSENFLRQLREIDGPWWRSRILPESERRSIVAKQEQLLIDLLSRTLSESQIKRLRQLELQAQGPRMLLRSEVIDFLQLTAAQQTEVNSIFAKSEKLISEASLPANRGDETKLNAARQAKGDELAAALKLLTPEQQRALPELLGASFETAKLSRIYPLAPELIESKAWVGNRQVKLEDLRGKVVLLHFYAFQCHNCKANFKHYNRWQQTLAERGVAVVGIQTPELADERDPLKVAAAAEEQGFEFPVLIDLENANWEAWGNTMWPTIYVIDREGYIRLWWQGELNWQGAKGDQAIEELVEKLLK
jgi:peroxiredoxin